MKGVLHILSYSSGKKERKISKKPIICATAPKKPKFNTISINPPKYTKDPFFLPEYRQTNLFSQKTLRSLSGQ